MVLFFRSALLILVFLIISSFLEAAQTASLALSSGTAPAGATATAQLSLTQNAKPAALQWTLTYPPGDVTAVSVAEGPAAVASAKTVTCASTPGRTICVLVGLNQNTIQAGVVASLSFQLSGAPSSTAIPVGLSGTVAASPEADEIPSSGTGNVITVPVSAPPALTALGCTPATLPSPSTASCTVTLDKAAGTGGTAVALSSSNPRVTVPASVLVASGAKTAAFTAAVASGIAADAAAVLTARTAAGSSKTATLAIAIPTQVASLICSPATVVPGGSATCTVTLNETAPASGILVALDSPSSTLVVPAALTIRSAISATFTISATAAAADQATTVLAVLSGITKSVPFSVKRNPQVAGLLCSPDAVFPGSSVPCTVTLTQTAPASGASVRLTSSASAALSVPASVPVPGGRKTASFTASAPAAAAAQKVTLSAAAGTEAPLTEVLTVTAWPRLAGLTCTPATQISGKSFTCAVLLASPAPAGLPALAIAAAAPADAPDSLAFAPGSAKAQFTVATATVKTPQTVTVTVALGGQKSSAPVALETAPLFHFMGSPPEFIGMVNGSAVLPAVPVSGAPARLTVRGDGYLRFVPFLGDAGVSFGAGGVLNTSTAFISLTGANLRNVFQKEGEISFSLKSARSIADRQKLSVVPRMVFDAFADSNRLSLFMVYMVQNRLGFMYSAGGSALFSYFVPPGEEEKLFGLGTVAKFRVVWNSQTVTLYLNGTAVKTDRYSPVAPNWTPSSSFTIGAVDPHAFQGGYLSLDDALADFQIR